MDKGHESKWTTARKPGHQIQSTLRTVMESPDRKSRQTGNRQGQSSETVDRSGYEAETRRRGQEAEGRSGYRQSVKRRLADCLHLRGTGESDDVG